MLYAYEKSNIIYNYIYSQSYISRDEVKSYLEWMIDLSYTLGISDETNTLAIWNVHRCLNVLDVKPNQLKKLVCSALYLSDLYIGNGNREYHKYTDFICDISKLEFIDMCHTVYKLMDYNLFFPTPFLFIAKESFINPKCKMLALSICKYISPFIEILDFLPSEIASTCVYISKYLFKEDITENNSALVSLVLYCLKNSQYYRSLTMFYTDLENIKIVSFNIHKQVRLKLIQKLNYIMISPYYAVQFISNGTYGSVYYVKHRISNQFVVLKQHFVDEDAIFTDCLLRESSTLQILKRFPHPNLVCDASIFFDGKQYNTITGNHGNPLRFKKNPKNIAKALLQGLEHLNSLGLYHRDLSCNNVLVHKDNVKIIDYGMCVFRSNIIFKSSNCCTLWYRPIETLLGYNYYGDKQESWSAGCLLLRLFLKKFPFRDTCEIGHIYNIYKLLGTPKDEKLSLLPEYSSNTPQWEKSLKLEDPQIDDLISKMLDYNIDNRLSISDAIKHPYFNI